MRLQDGYILQPGPRFRDANNRTCSVLDVVEYEHGERRGILLDGTPDGEAYVMFRDTCDVELVKWRSLCKVPSIDET